MIIQTWPVNEVGHEKTLFYGEMSKDPFYGEIAAVLPCAFKGIITLPTELEYDSQN